MNTYFKDSLAIEEGPEFQAICLWKAGQSPSVVYGRFYANTI